MTTVFLAAQDLAHELDGPFLVGKVDDNGDVLVFLHAVGIDGEKQTPTADIGGGRLDGTTVDEQLHLKTNLKPLEEPLLRLI